MVYDRSHIAENFRGLIGFVPSFDSGNINATVDSSLSQSTSGQYINELNPLFTAENFSNTSSKFSSFTIAAYDATATYLRKAVVKSAGFIYVAIADSTNSLPDTNPAKWKKTNLLSIWFQDKYDAAVYDTIDALLKKKKLAVTGKELRGNTQLYGSEGLRSNLIAKSGRFVGFEITVKDNDVSVAAQRIAMQLNAAATVPIHIMYNGTDTVFDFTASNPNKFYAGNITIPSSFIAGNGTVIIGYYENDLGAASAINLATDVFNDDFCYSCGKVDSSQRKAWNSFIDVKPISILAGETTYESLTNFGLNIAFSFRCDLTDLFIQERDLFLPALKARLEVKLLEELTWNLRNNGQADTIGNYAMAQLKDWNDPENPTIMFRQEIQALDIEFSAINHRCLPCASGMKIRTTFT